MKALLEECRKKVERIKAAKDDGFYAKMYVEDVSKLLVEIDQLLLDRDYPEEES